MPTTKTSSDSKRTAHIFDSLSEAIINGKYFYNERLPSERDLAEQFSAARGTIRSVLQQLEDAKLVKRKFRGSAYVSYATSFERDDIAEQTSPLELIETRLSIEPHMVKLVVTHASQRDLKKLDAALKQVLASKDPDEFSAADEAFHMTLSQSSQNPLIIWMYQRINSIRAHSQWSERKNNILIPEKIKQYNEQHAELMRQIKQRDRDGAAKAMIAHLNQAKKDVLGSY